MTGTPIGTGATSRSITLQVADITVGRGNLGRLALKCGRVSIAEFTYPFMEIDAEGKIAARIAALLNSDMDLRTIIAEAAVGGPSPAMDAAGGSHGGDRRA